MDFETNKKVNETITTLCDYILKKINSDSVEQNEDLPSLVGALANLIHSR